MSQQSAETGQASGGTTDNTRLAIQQAALELFSTAGFAGTGIRLIAQRAGISLASLYHYMSSKEDLLVGMMRENILTLLRDAEKELTGRRRPTERLAALVEVHVTTHATQRLLCIVSDTELRSLSKERREEVVAYRDRYEDLWRETIDLGVASGDFATHDTAVASSALLEMCTGVAHWFREGGRLSLAEINALYIDMALGLLAGSPTSRRPRNSRPHIESGGVEQ